jgi:hypothetical protein
MVKQDQIPLTFYRKQNMLFSQVKLILSQLMPGMTNGYHPLDLPNDVWDSVIRSDNDFCAMLDWMKGQGLGESALTVMVSDEGVKLAVPGIWIYNDQPVILFGFRDNKPMYATLDGLLLTKAEKNLYTATLGDTEFPILFRLQSETPNDSLPAVLSISRAKTLAKPLTVGDKVDDWVKFREVIGEGESLEVTVKRTEIKQLSKDGKNYKVWLAYTDHSTFMLSEKQHNYLESVQAYRDLTGTVDQPLKIKITQDGFFNEHKKYTLTIAD